MKTLWILVFFLHNLQGEGKEDQLNLATFPTRMACEQVLTQAPDKTDLTCIGITTQHFATKPDAQTPWLEKTQPLNHEFKLKQWV